MHEIERDELQRFSVRLSVAKRLVGGFLLIGLGLYALTALMFICFHGSWATLVTKWYGLTAARWDLIAFLYFAVIKGFFVGIVFPLWLSVLLAGKWVRGKLAA